MKFGAFIATIAIFSALVGLGESTIEDAAEKLPYEMVDVLVNNSETAQFIRVLKSKLNYATFSDMSIRASLEVDKESITIKSIGKSAVSVSFKINVPDLTVDGDIKYSSSVIKDNGNFTVIALGNFTLQVDVYYAPRTKAIILKGSTVENSDDIVSDFAWTKDSSKNSNSLATVKTTVQEVVQDGDNLVESYQQVIRSRKADILKSLDQYYIQ